MDNLTHTLVGVLAGEVAARATRDDPQGLPASARRGTLVAMGIIGGALPDIDLAWSLQVVTGDKLGYLLHHRGHTHTLAGCVLLGLLMYGLVLLWMRWRGWRPGPRDRAAFALMAMCAVLLHLGMDALNVYGVHPFWPWDNRWYYGDSVFIIEPLYWLAAAPLLFAVRGRVPRLLLAVVLAAATALLWYAHRAWLPGWFAPLIVMACVALAGRLSPRAAVYAGTAFVAGVTLLFMLAGREARRRVADMAATDFPAMRTLDVVLSPAPAHPFCWDVQLVQASPVQYVVREGRMSLLSGLAGRQCPVTRTGPGRTTPFGPVRAPARPALYWEGEYSLPRERLVAAANHDCAARGMMQFLRVPVVVQRDGGWVLGDLRFDREPGEGFAEQRFEPGVQTPCRYALPWVPPRAELLRTP